MHGLSPALVALVGALVRSVPWSLLLFIAATAALGTALTTSGATGWIAGAVFGPVQGASPVAMFARLDGIPTYNRADLLRLSVWLAPLTTALIVLCSLFLWPHLGLPLR